jgi:hypothetical protein
MRTTTILLFTMLSATSAAAQTQTAQPQQPAAPPRCDTPEFRQFDFWVGDWVVVNGGQELGRNRITLEEDGCVVHEHWTGAGGGTGQSFNFYDRRDGRWHQVWVSSWGGALNLSGALTDGAMRYTGLTRRPDGGTMEHRLSFTPNADGTVRQLWETSTDGGKTWSTAFDGTYRKAQP